MAVRDLHLAELHERARELGVRGYRLLGRDELIKKIEGSPAPSDAPEQAGKASPDQQERPKRRRGSRGGRGRRRGGQPRDESAAPAAERDQPRRREREEEPAAEQETEEVTGVLDRMPQGYGFLRLGGLDASEGDVYVSASQIRRCELRAGDEVSGPARQPRRGERHRALVRVGSVNGQDPEGERAQFEDLTPVAPHRRLPLDGKDVEPIARAVDLLTPLAFGQRVLVLAEPRSGRTTLLRAVAGPIQRGGARVTVLLADERPEEVTAWEQAVPEAEIVAAPADQEPADQVRAAELAMGLAKRRAESGEDVVILIDSLSRLALGYRDPARVKRVFGAGRELSEEGTGSLTVIATVLASDDRGEEVRAALETTENVLIRLDPSLASAGIVPSLLVAESRVSGEEAVRSEEELAAVRELRSELEPLDPEEAARELGERIERTSSNSELLSSDG
jgi:transcription termination factor Rho